MRSKIYRMARYLVLNFRPYPNRTEHVNFGIAVFTEDRGTSIHLIDSLKKLTAISPGVNLGMFRKSAESLVQQIVKMDASEALTYLKLLDLIDNKIEEKQLGSFLYDSNDERSFKKQVNLSLLSQCAPVRYSLNKRAKETTLFKEVKKEFGDLKILAKDEVESNSLVMTNYYADPETEFKIEFALQNDILRVAQTMDLRLSGNNEISAHHKQDALAKILSIMMTKEQINNRMKSYLLVAGADSKAANKVISPFVDRVDRIMHWEKLDDRHEFLHDWVTAAHMDLPQVPI